MYMFTMPLFATLSVAFLKSQAPLKGEVMKLEVKSEVRHDPGGDLFGMDPIGGLWADSFVSVCVFVFGDGE